MDEKSKTPWGFIIGGGIAALAGLLLSGGGLMGILLAVVGALAVGGLAQWSTENTTIVDKVGGWFGSKGNEQTTAPVEKNGLEKTRDFFYDSEKDQFTLASKVTGTVMMVGGVVGANKRYVKPYFQGWRNYFDVNTTKQLFAEFQKTGVRELTPKEYNALVNVKNNPELIKKLNLKSSENGDFNAFAKHHEAKYQAAFEARLQANSISASTTAKPVVALTKPTNIMAETAAPTAEAMPAVAPKSALNQWFGKQWEAVKNYPAKVVRDFKIVFGKPPYPPAIGAAAAAVTNAPIEPTLPIAAHTSTETKPIMPHDSPVKGGPKLNSNIAADRTSLMHHGVPGVETPTAPSTPKIAPSKLGFSANAGLQTYAAFGSSVAAYDNFNAGNIGQTVLHSTNALANAGALGAQTVDVLKGAATASTASRMLGASANTLMAPVLAYQSVQEFNQGHFVDGSVHGGVAAGTTAHLGAMALKKLAPSLALKYGGRYLACLATPGAGWAVGAVGLAYDGAKLGKAGFDASYAYMTGYADENAKTYNRPQLSRAFISNEMPPTLFEFENTRRALLADIKDQVIASELQSDEAKALSQKLSTELFATATTSAAIEQRLKEREHVLTLQLNAAKERGGDKWRMAQQELEQVKAAQIELFGEEGKGGTFGDGALSFKAREQRANKGGSHIQDMRDFVQHYQTLRHAFTTQQISEAEFVGSMQQMTLKNFQKHEEIVKQQIENKFTEKEWRAPDYNNLEDKQKLAELYKAYRNSDDHKALISSNEAVVKSYGISADSYLFDKILFTSKNLERENHAVNEVETALATQQQQENDSLTQSATQSNLGVMNPPTFVAAAPQSTQNPLLKD